MKFVSKSLLIVTLLFPLVVYAYGKPLKILSPEYFGVECVEKWLCVDDPSRLDEAKTLYIKSMDSIEAKLSPLSEKPKVVFCSTYTCFKKFGFDKQAGQSIGKIGVVIGPRGWARHYVMHEMIHQWQSEKFGSIAVWISQDWIIEGMAYYISDDPRVVLNEPFQSYRRAYENRFGKLLGRELVDELRKAM